MFSKRKSKPKGPSETEIYLTKNANSVDIRELLQKEDMSTQFREKNPILIGYFLGKNKEGGLNMEDIFKYIMRTDNRNDQKQLFSLYQMSNVCLHRVFADSVDISKLALQSIGQEKPEKQYAMGVFSRIISRAIDQWPEEIWQVFWNTEAAVSTIIMNLDSSCIYQSILDCFVQKHHPHISTLLWFIFLSFISEEKAREYLQNPPPFIIFIPNVDDFNNYDPNISKCHNSLTKIHKFNIISLFIEYFKCSFDKIAEFHEKVFDYIASANENDLNEKEIRKINGQDEEVTIEIYPKIFEIAKIIGPNEKVIKKSLEIIEKSDDLSELKVQYCAQYLSICTEVMKNEDAQNIITKLLVPQTKQLTITAVLQLVSYFIEDQIKTNKTENLNKFRENIRNDIVIPLLKEHSEDHLKDNQDPSTFMLLDAALTIARIIYNSELNELIQKENDGKKSKKKTKKNKFSEEEDENEEEELSLSKSTFGQKGKSANVNVNDTVDEKFSQVAEKWGDFKHMVCYWSKPSFLTLNIEKGSKKISTKREELEQRIVVKFINEPETQELPEPEENSDKEEEED